VYDVTVVGAGLAGLQVARLLARGGASVLLVDARRDVSACIRTTGIFVRRTFDDFPSLDPFLGPAIRSIGLHSPSGRTIELVTKRDEFRIGRMSALYAAMLQQAISAGAEWRPSTVYAGLRVDADLSIIRFRDGTSVRSRFVVGADGARSRIARDLALDRNERWITGVEHVFRSSSSPGQPRFDCWIDPRIAPGYLAWSVDDGESMHVGVGGDPRRYDAMNALSMLTRRVTSAAPIETRGGLIPVNGVLRRIGNSRGLLVGDAAGAVSPLTAGGLDACMRLSAHAADVLLGALRGTTTLESYDGSAFRSRYASRIVMRHLFEIATRSRLAIELGFALARNPVVDRFIRHVFFGRGSFPDAALRPAGELRINALPRQPASAPPRRSP
jgi:flavin-dependent dehydrogenase